MHASRLLGLAAPLLAIAALAGCGSSGGSGRASGAAAGPAGARPFLAAAERYSACMRHHGVPNFPDPVFFHHGNEAGLKLTLTGIDKASPEFQAAQQHCAALLPDKGAGSLDATPAHRQAMLAFARCVRSRGFPRFPDPTSQGQLTPEMVTAAGIDLHQVALLQAGDACVGLTHGYLTRAAIARAVNDGGP